MMTIHQLHQLANHPRSLQKKPNAESSQASYIQQTLLAYECHLVHANCVYVPCTNKLDTTIVIHAHQQLYCTQ